MPGREQLALLLELRRKVHFVDSRVVRCELGHPQRPRVEPGPEEDHLLDPHAEPFTHEVVDEPRPQADRVDEERELHEALRPLLGVSACGAEDRGVGVVEEALRRGTLSLQGADRGDRERGVGGGDHWLAHLEVVDRQWKAMHPGAKIRPRHAWTLPERHFVTWR